jgi:hypothetical protein
MPAFRIGEEIGVKHTEKDTEPYSTFLVEIRFLIIFALFPMGSKILPSMRKKISILGNSFYVLI